MTNSAPPHQGLDYIPLQQGQGQGQVSNDIPMATGDKYDDASPAPAPAIVAQPPVVVQVRDHFVNGTNSRTSHFAAQSQPQQQPPTQAHNTYDNNTANEKNYQHTVDFIVTDNSPVDTRKNSKVSGYNFQKFQHNVHNWRKKESWIVFFIAMTIVFTVLGVKVWAPMASNGSGSGSGSSGPPPSVAPPAMSCRMQCTTNWAECRRGCEATDEPLKTCVAGCPVGDHSCTANCGFTNTCYNACSNTLHACSSACPSLTS